MSNNEVIPSSLQLDEKLCERIPLTPHVLLADTFTVPAPAPHVTSMSLVPCPASIVPLETVQLNVGVGDGETTLKLTDAPAHHDKGFAVIEPGVDGLPLIVIVLGVLLPGVQAVVLAVTLRNPLVKEDDTLSNIVVEPCPLVIVVPAGFVHVKLVAPGTLAIEY